jgi:peptide/nickel transport system substrate-binding protein
VRLVADRSAMRTAFLSGQVHQYSAEDKRESDGLAGQGYMVRSDAAFNFVPVTMNAERPPFNDPRARRAVSRAINRKQIIDIVYAGDAKPNGLVHWPCGVGTYAFDAAELDELQPHDLEEARQLVDALGGLRLRFTYPAGATIAQHDRQLPIFVEQMKAAGIELQEEPLPLPSWLDAYRNRNYEMSLGLTQVIETPEFPLNWHSALGPAGDGSFGRGLNDPEIEAALLKTKTTLDTEERIEAVRDAQRVIYEKDPMFLPLVCAYNYTAYNQAVHNVPEGLGTTAFLLNTMWLDA